MRPRAASWPSGDAYAAQGKLKEASIEYRNALKAVPDLVDAHYQLGRVYLQTDEPEKAYQSFVRAANLDSSHADAHVKAGTLLLVAGDYREARALAERALKASPESADAHILLGNALAGLDNPSRALNQIEQAIHLDPTYAPAWTTLGALQFHGGKREQARQDFQKAVDLDPKSADARVALANYEWATGDTKAAEAALRATLLDGAAEPGRASRAGPALPDDEASQAGRTALPGTRHVTREGSSPWPTSTSAPRRRPPRGASSTSCAAGDSKAPQPRRKAPARDARVLRWTQARSASHHRRDPRRASEECRRTERQGTDAPRRRLSPGGG